MICSHSSQFCYICSSHTFSVHRSSFNPFRTNTVLRIWFHLNVSLITNAMYCLLLGCILLRVAMIHLECWVRWNSNMLLILTDRSRHWKLNNCWFALHRHGIIVYNNKVSRSCWAKLPRYYLKFTVLVQ